MNTEVKINQLTFHFQVYDALSAQKHLRLITLMKDTNWLTM